MRNYIGEEGVLKSELRELILENERLSLCKKTWLPTLSSAVDDQLIRLYTVFRRTLTASAVENSVISGIPPENC